jgi:NTE family protein
MTDSTAFVFVGGASLGAVQVGMLKALAAAGIVPQRVTGVSVGAINAVCYAADPTPAGVARLEQLWRGIRRSDIFPPAGWRSVLRLVRGEPNLLSSAGLARLLVRELPIQDLSQARLPCTVIAADAQTGTAVGWQDGPALEALLASAAIPGLFPPIERDGRTYIDGGVAYQAPFATAIQQGAKTLYVLPTGYTCAGRKAPDSALAHAAHALNLLILSKLIGCIQFYSRQCDIRVVPPLCPLHVSPLDFSQTGHLIDTAEQQTRDWLRNGTAMVDGLPHQLAPHSH